MRAAWLLVAPVWYINSLLYTPVGSDPFGERGCQSCRPQSAGCLPFDETTRSSTETGGTSRTATNVDIHASGGGAAPHVSVWIVAERHLAP